MWRSFFLAIGISMIILGVELLMIDKAVLANTQADPSQLRVPTTVGSREFRPKEWMPWSLMSGGAVIIIYSLTLTKEGGG